MQHGYILDFSNRTFQEFVAGSVERDIYDKKYDYASGSKANRLRGFWKEEPNYLVGKLVNDLIDYSPEVYEVSENLIEECRRIANRLLQEQPVEDIDAIAPISPEKAFDALAREVKNSIEKHEPENGLDRLHTFVVKYIRALCDKHRLRKDRTIPLHGLFGQYVKELKRTGKIESDMGERILKSTISVLEAFNSVRNDQSFAHDNPLLTYHESILIFNSVASLIKYLSAIESAQNQVESSSSLELIDDDLPF